MGLTSLWSVLFLAFCIPINVTSLWAYRKQLQQIKFQQSAVGNTAWNVTVKEEQIEKRLLYFAVLTFLGHVIISLMLVSEFKAFNF
jgi:hypothetical protein